MTQCRICGRTFDPQAFQVVVPALEQGFDRMECAEAALSGGVPAPPPAAAPPATVVKPFPAPAPALTSSAAPAALGSDRRPVLLGGNVALLAAGAATVYLWLRVFGADPSSSLFLPGESAARAFERATVPAFVDTVRERSVRPEPESVLARRTPPAPAPAPAAAEPTTPAPAATLAVSRTAQPSAPARGNGGGSGRGDGEGKGGGGGVAQPKPARSLRPAASPPVSTPTKSGLPAGKAKGEAKPKNANHQAAHGNGNGKKTGHDKHH